MALFRDSKTLHKFTSVYASDAGAFQPPTPSQSPRHFQTVGRAAALADLRQLAV